MKKWSMKAASTGGKQVQKLRFRLMLPVLVLPFLTAFFWVLGGGSGTGKVQRLELPEKGVNTSLPSPHFDKKETALDKLGFYEKADLDSARRGERQREDPYLSGGPTIGSKGDFGSLTGLGKGDLRSMRGKSVMEGQLYADSNAAKVERRLQELRAAIKAPVSDKSDLRQGMVAGEGDKVAFPQVSGGSPDVDRLERLMSGLHHLNDSASSDPELDKLNGMLDKVLRIQHPEIGQSSNKSSSETPVPTKLAPTLVKDDDGALKMLGRDQSDLRDTTKIEVSGGDDFFCFENTESPRTVEDNVIHAVVVSDQTLVSGSTVKLRLSDSVHLGNAIFPKNSFIYGTAVLSNERLLIAIKSIMGKNGIYPVNLEVYDLDGMAGIFIPGAIGRDVSKESAAEGVNSLGMTGFDASLGAQAATAGIQAAKTLISRKVKLVRVSLRAGYQVLIKEAKTGA